MAKGVHQQGFTLLELMVVATIAAILMGLAIPSYRYVTTSNRIAGEVNSLAGDIQFARYEAVREGLPVNICPAASATSTTCSTSTAWSNGWIVQPASSTTLVLRRQLPFSSFNSRDTITSTSTSLQFNREGFATGLAAAANFTFQEPTSNSAYKRCLMLSTAGMATTLLSGGSFLSVTC